MFLLLWRWYYGGLCGGGFIDFIVAFVDFIIIAFVFVVTVAQHRTVRGLLLFYYWWILGFLNLWFWFYISRLFSLFLWWLASFGRCWFLYHSLFFGSILLGFITFRLWSIFGFWWKAIIIVKDLLLLQQFTLLFDWLMMMFLSVIYYCLSLRKLDALLLINLQLSFLLLLLHFVLFKCFWYFICLAGVA